MYSAVVLDLDGTLLNSDKQISDRNYRSVLACYEQGIKIIFATARPPRAVKWFLPKEFLEIGSFVYYNGALISCIRSGIYLHEPINSVITTEVLNHCINYNHEIEIGIEVLDEWFSLKEIDYSIIMNVRGNPIVKSLEELKRYDATKILITGDLDIEMLQEKFNSKLNILVTDNGQLIQIMSKKASKELAVSKLLDPFDLQLERVIAFGDDHNDVGLFNACGRTVAMGNAVKELKNIASEITVSNDNDGVAVVLERILNET
jgi:Cof subfamily protein (haloacid dehalogenase superfamily)